VDIKATTPIALTLTNAKMEVICVKKTQLVITPLVGTIAHVILVLMEMERTALI
jgi:virulence-associated protein VagC